MLQHCKICGVLDHKEVSCPKIKEDAADQAEAVAPDPADRGALDEGRPDPAARQRDEVGGHDREPPSFDPPSTG